MQNKTLQKEAAPNEGPKHPTSNGGRRQQLTADFNQSVKPSKWELPRRPRSLARAVKPLDRTHHPSTRGALQPTTANHVCVCTCHKFSFFYYTATYVAV
jgi:hypothetical protein